MTMKLRIAIETTKARIEHHKEKLEAYRAEVEAALKRGDDDDFYIALHNHEIIGVELRMLEGQLFTLEGIAAEEDATESTPETKQEETTAEHQEPEKKPVKKAKPLNPAKFSPIAVYLDGGAEQLSKELANLDIQELKDIIREYSLDKTGNYRRWKDRERLVDLIMRRSEAKATRGDVFRIFTSEKKNAYTA